ncbi:SDR family NAD(P)-dependent oxidoreductase [Microvirga sp. HBU67558]|uniref:SDR family NAD(P)-dependent oxidoreductase n=1 Tax=Microvirga TaxID=186650 RepID=UPI001B3692EA|nr:MULTISPECIES: SDR family NAD(P)-dependent oxidoreductase [unclassified Microvirga]MBQ0820931.1 SDR family NAD(P)-dependent oxidoreductase [Microvirga sp. HBU67558]
MGVPIWLRIGNASGISPSMRRVPGSVWLIADSSSPVGLSVAKDVVQRGHRVILAARNTAAVQDLVRGFPNTTLVVALDGTSSDDITRIIQESKDQFGPIEVLVNTPGVGSLPSLG